MIIQKSLQKVINEWKFNEWIPNSKNFSIKKSPINEKEFMIEFKIEVDVKINDRSNIIRVEKRFFTFAQNDVSVNPKGDDYNLKNFLDLIDCKFQEKIDSMVSK